MRRLLVLTLLLLGLGVPSAHADPATTVPVITSPTEGSTVSGLVPVVASTTSSTVEFFLDGLSGGGASYQTASHQAQLQSYAWKNGAHQLTARDCPAGGCGPASAPVTITIANAAPAITTPSQGQLLTGVVTFTATAPGATLLYSFDGHPSYLVPEHGTRSLTVDTRTMRDGTHTVVATACPDNSFPCAGETSAPVTFQVKSLHPQFNGSAPSVLSPNGDGHQDTTTGYVTLPDVEHVEWSVLDRYAQQVISGPHSLGYQPRGRHSFTWNGTRNDGSTVHGAQYQLFVDTRAVVRGVTLKGRADGKVRVSIAPRVTNVMGINSTLFPRAYNTDQRWSYATLGAQLDVGVPLDLRIFDANGVLVEEMTSQYGDPGPRQFTWDGHDRFHRRLPYGHYHFTLTATDSDGNQTFAGPYPVSIDPHEVRYVQKVVTQQAELGAPARADAEAHCADNNPNDSHFGHGLYLYDGCHNVDDGYGGNYGPSWVPAQYTFTAPQCLSFNGVRLDVDGLSAKASTVHGSFSTYSHLTPLVGDLHPRSGTKEQWLAVARIGPPGHVSGRNLTATAALSAQADGVDHEELDMRQVRMVFACEAAV